MRRAWWVAAGAVLPVLILVGATRPAAAEQQQVTIRNFQSRPATVTVQAGDTVRWTNEDGFEHTVTFEDGSFDRELARSGGTATRRFDTAGEFPYVCRFHGHGGTVIVQAAAPPTTEPPTTVPTGPPAGSAPPPTASPTTASPTTATTAPASAPTGEPGTDSTATTGPTTTVAAVTTSSQGLTPTTTVGGPSAGGTGDGVAASAGDGGSGGGAGLAVAGVAVAAAGAAGLLAWRRRAARGSQSSG